MFICEIAFQATRGTMFFPKHHKRRSAPLLKLLLHSAPSSAATPVATVSQPFKLIYTSFVNSKLMPHSPPRVETARALTQKLNYSPLKNTVVGLKTGSPVQTPALQRTWWARFGDIVGDPTGCCCCCCWCVIKIRIICGN